KLIKNAKLSAPLKNGWTLFPHQKKAIVRALTMRRMILALDMGLGKTLIGAVWSKAFTETFGRGKLKVYIICPVSLKEEWRRTAVDKVDLKVSICSWAKVPTQVESHIEHFVVCCDEAHAMQSTQAQRTKDVLNLVDDKRCVGLLLLTGTPMKNGKPSNLFPLLKAVRHPLGRNQKAYEAHFCNGMLKNFGRGATWDASGCSNLDQLKQMVASNLLHMTKEQCLTDLPPMTNIFHDVPVSSRFQIQYEQAIVHLANIQANSSKLSDESVLGAVQRLRVVCAYAKVEATVELARTILNNEPAVVIFTFFAQVAKQVHSKLAASGWPCSLLTGETPQKKRQELVDNFQNGLTSVFVCTFGAGGVGLTLTAASTIVLLDRPWTPGETRQAEDRIRRIGQVKKCKSYWMRSFDLDKEIDATLESKKQ
ncbi:P-loop containing nucleoside triphosphate hydrolase protein, partial [Fragilariopsis cylindrus CCMP1102]